VDLAPQLAAEAPQEELYQHQQVLAALPRKGGKWMVKTLSRK